MRALQAMIMLLGALAVLMAGAVPASAAPTPPCHEATAHHAGMEAPGSTPDKVMKAMDCCVGWVTAPSLLQPEQPRAKAPAPTLIAAPAALLPGERPAPDPHPPRRAVS